MTVPLNPISGASRRQNSSACNRNGSPAPDNGTGEAVAPAGLPKHPSSREKAAETQEAIGNASRSVETHRTLLHTQSIPGGCVRQTDRQRVEQWLERINLSKRRIPIRSFRITNVDESVRDKLTNEKKKKKKKKKRCRLAQRAYKQAFGGPCPIKRTMPQNRRPDGGAAQSAHCAMMIRIFDKSGLLIARSASIVRSLGSSKTTRGSQSHGGFEPFVPASSACILGPSPRPIFGRRGNGNEGVMP